MKNKNYKTVEKIRFMAGYWFGFGFGAVGSKREKMKAEN